MMSSCMSVDDLEKSADPPIHSSRSADPRVPSSLSDNPPLNSSRSVASTSRSVVSTSRSVASTGHKSLAATQDVINYLEKVNVDTRLEDIDQVHSSGLAPSSDCSELFMKYKNKI